VNLGHVPFPAPKYIRPCYSNINIGSHRVSRYNPDIMLAYSVPSCVISSEWRVEFASPTNKNFSGMNGDEIA